MFKPKVIKKEGSGDAAVTGVFQNCNNSVQGLELFTAQIQQRIVRYAFAKGCPLCCRATLKNNACSKSATRAVVNALNMPTCSRNLRLNAISGFLARYSGTKHHSS